MGTAFTTPLLTLSYWPKSGTPRALKRDTSGGRTFAYLDASEFHVPAEAVSENHFDENGLVEIRLGPLITPRLTLECRSDTFVSTDRFLELLEHYLSTGAPDGDPYDPQTPVLPLPRISCC
jgi:hypothetical protein